MVHPVYMCTHARTHIPACNTHTSTRTRTHTST